VILGDLDAGGFFGELAAIDGKPRSAGVLAVTDAVIATMPGAVFMEVLRTYPDVSIQVLKLLAARVRALDNRVLEYSSLNVQQRVYSELLRLARPDPADARQGILSPAPIHSEIAARVSTHREAVAREMKLLEREGFLQRRRGALVLTDIPKLMEKLDRPD
jgi:CRP-like cAMP-binding protein